MSDSPPMTRSVNPSQRAPRGDSGPEKSSINSSGMGTSARSASSVRLGFPPAYFRLISLKPQ